MLFRKNIVTLIIIAINIIVFGLMVFSGVDFLQPSANDLIKYGANFNALLYNGEYYRLITHLFVHVGILHITVNMVALYSLGRNIEQYLGSGIFFCLYMLSGIAGGIASALWHAFSVSGGASGAIMGLAGADLAITFFRQEYSRYHGSALVTIVFNLLIGSIIPFIDNVAHIGGLIFGFVFTIAVVKMSATNKKMRWLMFAALILFSITAGIAAMSQLSPSAWNYYVSLNNYINYERDKQYGSDGYMDKDELIKRTKNRIMDWKECRDMLDTVHDLHPDLAADVNLLKMYTHYRIKALGQFVKAISEEEYQLLDSMEATQKLIASLPKLKHGIIPPEEQKDSTEEKNKLHDIIIYYDKDWKPTSKNLAYYYRNARVDSLNRINGFVYDYFIDGQVQMKGVYMNDIRHDIFRYYYYNGNYESMGRYVYEEKVGKWKDFYENGQIQRIVYYNNGISYVQSLWDSLGHAMVIDGNGLWKYPYDNGVIQDSGLYENGIQTGWWAGNFSNGKSYYKELYKEGKLIKGISYDESGNAYTYTERNTEPEPIGGMKSYNEYIKQNLVYTSDALKFKVEGIILVDLTIDKKGNLVHAETVNKLGFGCEEEALRLVYSKSLFSPAANRGQVTGAVKRVEIKFELPE